LAPAYWSESHGQGNQTIPERYVGDENFTDSLIDRIAYAKDASEHQHRPDAAVWPINTLQVSDIMKLANREKFPVVPRGAGTSLAWLAVPEEGDGNLHPVVCFDGTNADEVKRVEEASEELFKKVIELGGTLTGEHGIGLAKSRFMMFEHDEVSMDVMRSMKALFDPNNILNPGKMGLEA